jgi:hypothetical protein
MHLSTFAPRKTKNGWVIVATEIDGQVEQLVGVFKSKLKAASRIAKAPQLTARGNRYLTVIPAPLDRSSTIVSPALHSSRMASQQAFDQALPLRNSTTQFPRIDEDIYPTAMCGAPQLREQFMPEVIG